MASNRRTRLRSDHAKLCSFCFDIILVLLGFVFLQQSQVSLHRRTESTRKFWVARLYYYMFTEHHLQWFKY